MPDEKQLTLRPKPETPSPSRYQPRPPPQAIDSDAAKKEILGLSEKDLYRPAGRGGARAASTKLVRAWAQEQNLSCEETICEKTDDYVRVSIRGWAGPRVNPTMEREATVILRYRDMLRRAVLDAITDGVSYTYFDVQAKEKVFRKITPDRIKWEIDGDGYPIITDPQAYLAILNAHLQKIHFAERTARANALRIVFLELLGRDEEDGEKESEGETTEGKSETEEGQEEDPQKLLEDAIRQVIAKARTATGGDRDASSTLFRTTAEGVGLKIATPKEIKSVEEAQRILNALPLSVFEKDSSTRSESGDSVLDDPEKSKSDEIGELAKDPELEQRRNMVALECRQILEGRNTARFKTVEEVIAKMCELAEINNPTGDLQQIVSVEQGEMILQAILDYLVE